MLFAGHFHVWLVMREFLGGVSWASEDVLSLDSAGRHLIVVAPVVDGWGAIFDIDRGELTPVRVPV